MRTERSLNLEISMAVTTAFEIWLKKVAPGTLLQKALLLRLAATGHQATWLSADDRCWCALELSDLKLSDLKRTVRGEYQYASAIAHPLAQRWGCDVTMLADQLAAALTRAGSDQDGVAIAQALAVQATPTGTLRLTLSPTGLAAWLDRWPSEDEVLKSLGALPGYGTASRTKSRSWPLAEQLQLSLPMLWQWAGDRCQSWHDHGWLEPSMALTGERAIAPSEPIAWLLVPVVTTLLPLTLRSLDQLTARPASPDQIAQVGYHLAHAVYTLESTKAQWVPVAARSATHLTAKVVTVTQTLLAVVLAIS